MVPCSVLYKHTERDLLQSQHDGDDRACEPTYLLVAFQRYITGGGLRGRKTGLQEAVFWASGGKK